MSNWSLTKKLKALAPCSSSKGDTFHSINLCPVDTAKVFPNTYPVDSAIQRLNNWGWSFDLQWMINLIVYLPPYTTTSETSAIWLALSSGISP